jgi:hypothetical protein
MEDDKKDERASRAAKQLSKLGASKGGQARGHVLTPEERKEIARNAVKERWRRFYEAKGVTPEQAREEKKARERQEIKQARNEIMASSTDAEVLPYSLLRGELPLGGLKIECHVLNDHRRVITQSEFLKAITGIGTATNLSRYVARNALLANVFRHSPPIRFKIASNDPKPPVGLEATTLIEAAEQYLAARDAGSLTPRQLHLAARAEIIIRASAKVGIIALIDEATGFQQLRETNALRLKLQAFIAEDIQEWARMFPDEFWLQLARLEGVRYHPTSRPMRWGKYVMAFVYDAIDKDVANHLRKSNPNPTHGRNHHQWLKQFGRDRVHDQITGVIAIMKACDSFEEFQHKFAKVFKKQNQGQLLDWLEPA